MRQRKPQLDTRKRILWIALLFFTWMIIIIWRLGWLQVVSHEFYVAKAARNQQKDVTSIPIRGAIQDRNGKELAYTVLSDSLFVDLKLLKEDRDRQAASRILAPLLGYEEASLLKRLTGNASFLWLKRKLDPEAAMAVKKAIAENGLVGVSIKKESQRFYPNDTLAAHLVGYVGAEVKGLAGLEQTQERYLLGRSGEIELMRDAAGHFYDRRDNPAIDGARLMTTIDAALQHKVEVLLGEAMSMTKAKGASAIVLDPTNGEILALANVPTFDPNESPKTADDAVRHNRAISFPYEPGSVFKIVTYSAAFELGLANPDDRIDCGNGEISINRRVIHDTHSYGELSVSDAFAKSSNVGAIKLAQRVGQERLFEFVKRFGFGRKTGVELSGESRGIVNPLETWRADSIGSVAIGQEISVTLLQMVVGMAAIANRGVWVQPHLIKEIVTEDGQVLHRPQPETRRVISEETAQKMAYILQRVATNGTARHAIRLAGYTAAGKTGTAQKVDPKTRAYSKYMASFAGFVPANNPRFAIIVMVDEPVGLYHGGTVAAPIFNLIAEAALGDFLVLPDDQTFRDELVRLSKKYETEGVAEESGGDRTVAEVKDGPKSVSGREPRGAGGSRMTEVALSSATPSPVAGSRQTQKEPVWFREAAEGEIDSGVMPDFRGRGMRAVMQACSELNLKLKLYGSGIAVRQMPAAGTRVKSGDECRIEFQ